MYCDLHAMDTYEKKANVYQSGEKYVIGNVHLFHKPNSRENHSLASSQTILV